ARLQGEDIAALARGVYCLVDDPAGQASDECRPRGEEPVVRPAVRLVVPRRLALADRERTAVLARRFQDAERDRVDVCDRQRLGVAPGGGEVRRRLEAAEEVRLLEDDAGRSIGRATELVRVRR